MQYVLAEITSSSSGTAMFEVTLIIDDDHLDFHPSLNEGCGLSATISSIIENIFATTELIPRIVQPKIVPTPPTSDPYHGETYKGFIVLHGQCSF